jgi:hypothetical protein
MLFMLLYMYLQYWHLPSACLSGLVSVCLNQFSEFFSAMHDYIQLFSTMPYDIIEISYLQVNDVFMVIHMHLYFLHLTYFYLSYAP